MAAEATVDLSARYTAKVDSLVERYGKERTALLPILRDVNTEYGFVPEAAMARLSEITGIANAEIYGVVKFYSFFSTEPRGKFIIRLCRTMSCVMSQNAQGQASGSPLRKLMETFGFMKTPGQTWAHPVSETLMKELEIGFGETTADGMFTLEWTNCMGMCDQAPAMLVNEDVHVNLTAERVRDILAACRREAESAGGDFRKTAATDVASVRGTIGNPLSFSEEKPDTGLDAALAMGPEEVMETLVTAGLRGRGGAGFPTGKKWQFTRAQAEPEKYIVCNADEGEPGTFKDRMIMSEFPELLIEGMVIAGLTVGAKQGMIYLRGEYSYLRGHLEEALERCRARGVLGQGIKGNPDLSFDIGIYMGMGAYVCGEETALLESMEGRRGEPRNRFPFPVEQGYLGKPTVINNVETFAWVPCILTRGAEWFIAQGTESSKGRRLFSLSGDCARPGVYEYPFGTTLAQILSDVGAHDAKGALVGGACGTCIPADQFGRELAFEDLATGGSIIVFGPDRDMFAVAENIQAFFAEEGCGQCTPCRIGNARLLEMLSEGREHGITEDDVRKIRELSDTMGFASKCGLGQTAAHALVSIMENFGDELARGGTGDMKQGAAAEQVSA